MWYCEIIFYCSQDWEENGKKKKKKKDKVGIK